MSLSEFQCPFDGLKAVLEATALKIKFSFLYNFQADTQILCYGNAFSNLVKITSQSVIVCYKEIF